MIDHRPPPTTHMTPVKVFVTSLLQQSRGLFSYGYIMIEDRRNAVAEFLGRGQISMEHNL